MRKTVQINGNNIAMKRLDNTEEQRYLNARKQAREIRSFYINLMCYCIVIPALAVVNYLATPDKIWAIFPMLGWGTGLAFHGMGAFQYNPFLGDKWKERKIKELMEKDKTDKYY